MTKDSALRMALEALETELCIDWTNNDEFNESAEKMHEAIIAIKEALAQIEKIALLKQKTESHDVDCLCADCTEFDDLEDATAQPEKDIPKIGCVNHDCDKCKAQPEQEPVAKPKLIGWRTENFLWETDDIKKAQNWEPNIGVLPIFEGDPNTQLTTPPQRTWVELTDKEIKALAKRPNDIEIPMTGRMWIFVSELMDELKEKNT